jgi:hypothetical protein
MSLSGILSSKSAQIPSGKSGIPRLWYQPMRPKIQTVRELCFVSEVACLPGLENVSTPHPGHTGKYLRNWWRILQISYPFKEKTAPLDIGNSISTIGFYFSVLVLVCAYDNVRNAQISAE